MSTLHVKYDCIPCLIRTAYVTAKRRMGSTPSTQLHSNHDKAHEQYENACESLAD